MNAVYVWYEKKSAEVLCIYTDNYAVFGLLVKLVMCHRTGLGSNLHIENKYHFTACLFERVSLLRGHDCEEHKTQIIIETIIKDRLVFI